jgi:membrane-bound lytic murein transglycosylase MltF
MSRRILLVLVVLGILGAAALVVRRPDPSSTEAPQVDSAPAPPASLSDSALLAVTVPRLGDFDSMKARRRVRVLVVPSLTYYTVDRGTPRGMAVDAAALFQKYLNQKYHTGARPINVVLVPVRHDELIPSLLSGRGDIAASGLTATPERGKLVDFSAPIRSNVTEIVVAGPASPTLTKLEDLSGQEVFVRKSSTYYQNLEALNASFSRRGLAPVRLRPAPEALRDEDLLEMVNAGLVPLVVMNDYIASFWKQVLPDLVLHPEIAVATGGQIAWMIRKDSPLLNAECDAFLAKYPRGSATRNLLFQRYLQNTRYVTRATSQADVERFQRVKSLFQKYSAQYDLDYLLMMAQGYQESRLDQDARSAVGAVGIMQVMPETGRSLGVGDIHQAGPNVHAGIKYIRSIIDTYFAGDSIDALNRTLFAFAAYNAGPTRIMNLRRRAASRGLDPNVWSENVEIVAAEAIGRETVTYVSNIFEYYVGYTLLTEQAARRAAALKAR